MASQWGQVSGSQGGSSSFGNSGSTSSSNSSSNSSGNSSGESGVVDTPGSLLNLYKLYPMLGTRLGDLMNPGNWAGMMKQVGGPQAEPFPLISQGGIWSPQQVQGQVNLMRGRNDAATEGQIRNTGARLAGSGMGANSPLAQALQTNLQGQNLAANTSGENDLRFNAAQGNANMLLQQQQAGVGRAEAINAQDIQRRALTNNYLQGQISPLLQALLQIGQPRPFSKNQSQNLSNSIASSISNSQSDQGSQSNNSSWSNPVQLS